MPTRVQVPGKGIVEFPDGMSADDMKSALEKLAPPQAKPRTWVDTAVDWLPAVGGLVGGFAGAELGPGAIGTAALGAGAGEAYKQLINRARGKSAPPSATDAAKAIGTQAVVQGALPEAGGQLLGAAIKSVAPGMMQSALKPPAKMVTKDILAGEEMPRVVKTLLDEGVNVSPGGVAKLQRLLDASQSEIADAVAASNGEVSTHAVASRLTDVAKKYAMQVNPSSDLEAISRVGQEFVEGHAPTIPIQTAQAIKQGTYRVLGENAYNGVGVSAANEAAQKGLARGLKEEIAAQIPNLDGLNAREGQLLEALRVTGKRVALAGNKDPIGFAWVAQHPTEFLAAVIDRSAAAKSMIARGLYASAGAASKVAPQLIRTAVTALAADSSSDPGDQSQ